MKKPWLKFKLSLKMISLVDKFLMLFMLVLLVYSAFNLFNHEDHSQDTNAIDVIVRTSAAAIFGYFLSSNFTKRISSDITRSTDISTEEPGNADFHQLPSTIPAPAIQSKSLSCPS